MQIVVDLDVRPVLQLYRGLETFLANRDVLLASLGQTLYNQNTQRHM